MEYFDDLIEDDLIKYGSSYSGYEDIGNYLIWFIVLITLIVLNYNRKKEQSIFTGIFNAMKNEGVLVLLSMIIIVSILKYIA
jgi:hypothetical protein